MSLTRIGLVIALLFAAHQACIAQWKWAKTTIACPANRVYQDNRDKNGQEFCESILPGSIQVKDGPFQFWFNPDFLGEAGNYIEGRQVGKWRECSRFGDCEQKEYPAVFPEEKQRPGFEPRAPVSYLDGKYNFDFASCRETWVTHASEGKPDFELNIGSNSEGCTVSFLPEEVIEHGGPGDYTCTIPFQVGKRALSSLDLMSELPRLGLPQYCKQHILLTGPAPISVELSPRQGVTQIFTAKYDTGNNGAGIAQARLHFQKNAASRTNRCVVRYDPATKSLFLLSDQAGKYLGPIPAGGDDSLWNSECLLLGCSNAQLFGTTLTVHFAVRFNPDSFAGEHRVFLELVDTQKHASPAGICGHWTVHSAEADKPGKAWPSDRSCPASGGPPSSASQ